MTKQDREFAEKLYKLCKKLGLKTFLPHRDCGLWKEGKDIKEIARGDIKAFEDCNLLIASLNGFNIGAGTAWEMGYAEALGKRVIGLKTDKKVSESIAEVSAVIA